MEESKFRCATKKALDELANELNFRERIPEWDAMAGLSYTPSNPKDIDQYIEHYYLTKDDDKKFVLIEMILEANVLQPDQITFMKYWKKVQPIIIQDFLIHECTINYWSEMTEDSFENCKLLTPILKKIKLNQRRI